MVGAPGADRISTRLFEQGERSRAARALDKIRLTITLELPAIGGANEFNLDWRGKAWRNQQAKPADKSDSYY